MSERTEKKMRKLLRKSITAATIEKTKELAEAEFNRIIGKRDAERAERRRRRTRLVNLVRVLTFRKPL